LMTSFYENTSIVNPALESLKAQDVEVVIEGGEIILDFLYFLRIKQSSSSADKIVTIAQITRHLRQILFALSSSSNDSVSNHDTDVAMILNDINAKLNELQQTIEIATMIPDLTNITRSVRSVKEYIQKEWHEQLNDTPINLNDDSLMQLKCIILNTINVLRQFLTSKPTQEFAPYRDQVIYLKDLLA